MTWAAARGYVLALAALFGLLVAWELFCDLGRVPVWLLPSPSRIFWASWDYHEVLPRHIFATLWAVLGGFALAVAVGVPLAVAIVYSPFFRKVAYPILVVFQSVPKVAFAPLLLIWVGYGMSSNILVGALVAFFPIVIDTATGLESVEPDLLQLTRSLEVGQLKTFWKVRLPWAMPHVFSGMKVAITLAVVGAVVGEFVGADKGLGYLVLTSSSNMNTALVFGVLALLSVMGIVLFYAVVLVERLLCPWYMPVAEQTT
jgi:NitT/TauT family transport system permease protein